MSKTDETGDYNRGHSRKQAVEEMVTPLNSCGIKSGSLHDKCNPLFKYILQALFQKLMDFILFFFSSFHLYLCLFVISLKLSLVSS